MRLERKGFSEIGRVLGRDRSTIYREWRRNQHFNGHHHYYTLSKAIEKANGRRLTSHRNYRFTKRDWKLVWGYLEKDLSPEQISATLKKEGLLSISHETIYRHIWKDKFRGGSLYRHLRQSPKRRRKRYGTKESRGRLAGKRMITERPAFIERRDEIGHWEGDTVVGKGSKDCIVTLVERKTGFVVIGKLKARTSEQLNRRLIDLIQRQNGKVKTITVDNGTEFHGYKQIEKKTGIKFYFANPHSSWQRGLNENTNGLIRQYLPKGMSMKFVSQRDCNRISRKLNARPRRRLKFQTPEHLYAA
jgi:IS30 family transposase